MTNRRNKEFTATIWFDLILKKRFNEEKFVVDHRVMQKENCDGKPLRINISKKWRITRIKLDVNRQTLLQSSLVAASKTSKGIGLSLLLAASKTFVRHR